MVSDKTIGRGVRGGLRAALKAGKAIVKVLSKTQHDKVAKALRGGISTGSQGRRHDKHRHRRRRVHR